MRIVKFLIWVCSWALTVYTLLKALILSLTFKKVVLSLVNLQKIKGLKDVF